MAERRIRFQWDGIKASRNPLLHNGVSFEAATNVWDDPDRLITYDRNENGEDRWHMTGLVGIFTLLVVVHSYPDPVDETVVRIISARRATRPERMEYDKRRS